MKKEREVRGKHRSGGSSSDDGRRGKKRRA